MAPNQYPRDIYHLSLLPSDSLSPFCMLCWHREWPVHGIGTIVLDWLTGHRFNKAAPVQPLHYCPILRLLFLIISLPRIFLVIINLRGLFQLRSRNTDRLSLLFRSLASARERKSGI
ncbi:hypothetical protein K445DRAFT_251677 [Daldinia sp. EC12]|nr:hypothetical protein K445DRAFT_251677 [Daldinia sp. EC12]